MAEVDREQIKREIAQRLKAGIPLSEPLREMLDEQGVSGEEIGTDKTVARSVLNSEITTPEIALAVMDAVVNDLIADPPEGMEIVREGDQVLIDIAGAGVNEVTVQAFAQAVYPQAFQVPLELVGGADEEFAARVRDRLMREAKQAGTIEVSVADAAVAATNEALDKMIADGYGHGGMSLRRASDDTIEIINADGEVIVTRSVREISRDTFPTAFEPVDPIQRAWERMMRDEMADEEVTSPDVALGVTEMIVDTLVENSGEEDLTFERLSRGRVHVTRQGETKEMTVEWIARQQFPNAFRVQPYGRWSDAMDAQARLYEWTRTNEGRRFCDAFQDDQNSKHVARARMPDGMLHQLQMLTLHEAEPVWVAPEIIDLVHHARDTWEVEEIRGSDAFTPSGFCLLSRPLIMHDAPPVEEAPYRSKDGVMPVRAVAWTSVIGDDDETGCFWISFYSHIDDDPGHYEWTEEELQELRSRSPLMLSHVFQWTWGDRPVENALLKPVDGEPVEETNRRLKEQAATMQTLFRLSQQLMPVKHKAPRGQRRDASRKLRREISNVNVVTLRRERSIGESEQTDRHYHVTFIVRGYWSPRMVKADPDQPPNGPLVRKKVWVRGHLKGQGPLRENDRVWDFSR